MKQASEQELLLLDRITAAENRADIIEAQFKEEMSGLREQIANLYARHEGIKGRVA